MWFIFSCPFVSRPDAATTPQFISIVKVIVENVPKGEEMKGIDMMSTLLTVAGLLTRLQDIIGNRLKLKFCALCDSFLDRADSFSLRKDNLSRVGIADLIIDWGQEPAQPEAGVGAVPLAVG